jgi:hypothetical protein
MYRLLQTWSDGTSTVEPGSRLLFFFFSYTYTFIMSSSSRYFALYLCLSAVALYYMRLGPVSKSTGVHLETLIAGTAVNFTYPGRNLAIRQHYTGVKGIDGFLSVLVTAFLAGPMGFKKHIQLQQMNFLASWTAVLVVWSVESVRRRNGWSLIV